MEPQITGKLLLDSPDVSQCFANTGRMHVERSCKLVPQSLRAETTSELPDKDFPQASSFWLMQVTADTAQASFPACAVMFSFFKMSWLLRHCIDDPKFDIAVLLTSMLTPEPIEENWAHTGVMR